MAAGSLLRGDAGQPDRRLRSGRPTSARARRRRAAPRNRAHFADDPISPIGPRCVARGAPRRQIARSSAWSWVSTSTRVPRRQLGEHQLGQHRHGVRVHRRDRVGQRRQRRRRTGARRASRPGAGRGRGGPGSGPARGRRGRRRRSRRTVRRRAARAARVTSPPQHCTPCWNGALSDRLRGERLGRDAPPTRSASRARRTASSSRLPPPIERPGRGRRRRPSWRRPRAARGRARR